MNQAAQNGGMPGFSMSGTSVYFPNQKGEPFDTQDPAATPIGLPPAFAMPPGASDQPSGSGIPPLSEGFGPLPGDFVHVGVPYPLRGPSVEELVDELERAIADAGPERVAAFIGEPVIGVGGMIPPHDDYWPAVTQVLRRHGILFIADEVVTGFGRTGALFACEHADVAPDVLCVGKALTGGCLTLAATLCTSAVAEGIGRGEGGALMHGPTFMANPLACAVAVASVRTLLAGDWQGRVRAIERQLAAELEPCRRMPAAR